jgi:hypothetical protein
VVNQVDFGVDEDANLVWAVERRVGGAGQGDTRAPGAAEHVISHAAVLARLVGVPRLRPAR